MPVSAPLTRRALLSGAATLLAAPSVARAQEAASAPPTTVPPANATLDQLLDAAARHDQLRAIVVWQGGREIAARGYRGFTADRPTNIKSASKSVISALAGIAIQKGVVEGLDQPIVQLLAASDLPANPDPRLARVTLGHLLSMQAGLGRQSGPNYGAWVSSRNWVRSALAAPFEAEPGGRMLYSTASTHLVSAILTRASGKSTLALARDWLGAIPGFAITGWERDPQGIYLGGNEMAMSTRSLLAFGATYAAGGEGVIPAPWIAESWRARTNSIFSGEAYGLGWFIARMGGVFGRPVRYGWGYGGQMIYVFPPSAGRPAAAVAMTSDPDRPSARSGYRGDLHALAARIVAA